MVHSAPDVAGPTPPPQWASSGPPVQHVPSGMQHPLQLLRLQNEPPTQTPVAQLPPQVPHPWLRLGPVQYMFVLPAWHCTNLKSSHPLHSLVPLPELLLEPELGSSS